MQEPLWKLEMTFMNYRTIAFLFVVILTIPVFAAAETGASCNCLNASTNITYENHTVYFRNNCSQSVWINANMGPNGPPFVLNNVSQGRGCTGCSCAGPGSAGWSNGGCCCPSINCTHQSCPNSSCNQGVSLPNEGGFEVAPGVPLNYTVSADPDYGGNAALFPRYGCTLSADGVHLDCDTGTCYVQGTPGTPPAGIVKCGGIQPNGPPDGSPQLPTTKMEIFFAATNWTQTDSDFYDVSLADGFNIPVQIEPVAGTYWTGGTAHNWCIQAGGTVDLFEKIREPAYANLSQKMLVLKNGRPVAIWSSCSYETQINKTGPGQVNATTHPGQGEQIWNLSCCKGSCGTEATCPINTLPASHKTSQFFGTYYNHTYTYQYGDDQANIPCKGEKAKKQLSSYLITFCGGRVLATATSEFVNVTPGTPVQVNDPSVGVSLSITSRAARNNQRVTILTFSPEHPPQTFNSTINPVGRYYELSSYIPCQDISLINISAHYDQADITARNISECRLRLYTYDDKNGTWMQLVPGGVDMSADLVWGHSPHFSVFAIGVSNATPPRVEDIIPVTPEPGNPLRMQLIANVSSETDVSYAWDVQGDGITDYSEIQPVHLYNESGEYLVCLEVIDEFGISANRSEIVLVPDFLVPLEPGWNFVSVPKRLAGGYSNASVVFGQIGSITNVIFTYDASTGMWGQMVENTLVRPLDGFWVRSSDPALVPVLFSREPVQLPSSKHLYPGWNAIGHSDLEPLSANLSLMPVRETWTTLLPYNASGQSYEPSIIKGVKTGSHSEDRMMEPGQGYWLFMTGEGDLPAISA